MPFVVKAGAKSIGVVKRKSKKSVNKVLANEFRRKNKVSILKIRAMKKKR